ncbi:MAG: hypothetical protein HYV77_02030 [Candidatus Wildermuthbacteria bacterium]|nr:hypothetical protein [Candidatus Wildermuthbacteria bacterium]
MKHGAAYTTFGTLTAGNTPSFSLSTSTTLGGNAIYYATGTDVPLADGGTGASLTDPGADRIMFWDESANVVTWLTAGTGLSITDTTISASGTGDVSAASNLTDNAVVRGDGGVKGVQTSSVLIDDSNNITGVVGLTLTGNLTFSGSALDIIAASGTAAALDITDGTNAYLTFDTRTTNSGSSALTLTAGTAPTIASAAGAEYTTFTLTPPAITLTGTTQVTTQMDSILFNAPTITDASAVTVDKASTLTIAGAPTAAGSVTITDALALSVNAGDAYFGGNIGIGDTNPSEDLVLADGKAMLFDGTTSLINAHFGFGRLENQLDETGDFSDSPWTLSGITVTKDSVAAPNGLTEADTLVDDATPGGSTSQVENDADASEVWTFSVWLKNNDVSGATVSISLTDDQAGSATTNITLTSSWKRYSVTHTGAASATQMTAAINHSSNASDSFYAWGAQMELASVPGPYVHNAGATDSQDFASRAGGIIFNSINTGSAMGSVVFRSDGTATPALELSTGVLGGNTIPFMVGSNSGEAYLWIQAGNQFQIQGASNAVHLNVANSGASGNSYFKLLDASGTSKFQVQDSGDVEVFYVDSDGNISANIAATGSYTNALCWDASGVSLIQDCVGSVVADYMEMYSVKDDIEVGNIVVPSNEIVETTNRHSIAVLTKSSIPYEGKILGIISNPETAGDFNSIGYNIKDEDNPMPLALNGRVYVKVNLENGPIKIGDNITSSSEAGVGMKATEPGRVVGVALESFEEGDGDGKVMVFVNPHWSMGEFDLEGLLAQSQSDSSRGSFMQDILAGLTGSIRAGGEWVFDKITARTARIEKLEMVDQKTGKIYCTWIADGDWVKVEAECDQIEYLNGQVIIRGQEPQNPAPAAQDNEEQEQQTQQNEQPEEQQNDPVSEETQAEDRAVNDDGKAQEEEAQEAVIEPEESSDTENGSGEENAPVEIVEVLAKEDNGAQEEISAAEEASVAEPAVEQPAEDLVGAPADTEPVLPESVADQPSEELAQPVEPIATTGEGQEASSQAAESEGSADQQ